MMDGVGLGGRLIGGPSWQIGAAGDQACTAFIGDVGPRPLNENQKPVAKTDEKKNVDEQPRQPGDEAGDVDACRTRRRRRRGRWWPGCPCPSNGRRARESISRPFAKIATRLGCPELNAAGFSSSRISLATKRPCWIATGATPGSILPCSSFNAARSPITNTSGCPGTLRSGCTRTRPARSTGCTETSCRAGRPQLPRPTV